MRGLDGIVLLGLLMIGIETGALLLLLGQVKSYRKKFSQEGFNFSWKALYLYMMTGLFGILLLGISLIGIVAGIVIGIILLILWLKRRKSANVQNASASPSLSNPTDAQAQESKPKVCRSRCWCCLNCLDCQQRRPPGFEPFPKKKRKRKYSITQSERRRRSQRMKKRWVKDREGMLKKIREGIWRWILDMEPCGCWCCKICSRCQAEERYKRSKAKPQEKDQKAQERTKNGKKQSSTEQIKSSGKRAISSKKRIKSRIKSPRASQKVKKARVKTLKDLADRKNSSPFARIWEVIKKCGDAIWKFFKRLWIHSGSCKRRKAHKRQIKSRKLSRKTGKTRTNPPKDAGDHKNFLLFTVIWEVIKKCGEAISEIFRKLKTKAHAGSRTQKGVKRNKSPPV